MAQSDATKIKNSWSLIAFAKSHGEMKAKYPCINHETGETYLSCMFFAKNDNGETVATPVGYSQKLGVLDASEIVSRKDNLQVVEREVEDGSTRYTLCNVGEGKGESVSLF